MTDHRDRPLRPPSAPNRRPPATPRGRSRWAPPAGSLVLAIATFLTLGPVLWTLWTSLTPQPPGGGDAQVGLGAYATSSTRSTWCCCSGTRVLVTGLVARGPDVHRRARRLRLRPAWSSAARTCCSASCWPR